MLICSQFRLIISSDIRLSDDILHKFMNSDECVCTNLVYMWVSSIHIHSMHIWNVILFIFPLFSDDRSLLSVGLVFFFNFIFITQFLTPTKASAIEDTHVFIPKHVKCGWPLPRKYVGCTRFKCNLAKCFF